MIPEKKELIKAINRLAKQTDDIELLHLVFKILSKSLAQELDAERMKENGNN